MQRELSSGFSKEDAVQVIKELVKPGKDKLMAEYNIHFIHASDEWYLLKTNGIFLRNVIIAIFSWKMELGCPFVRRGDYKR